MHDQDQCFEWSLIPEGLTEPEKPAKIMVDYIQMCGAICSSDGWYI